MPEILQQPTGRCRSQAHHITGRNPQYQPKPPGLDRNQLSRPTAYPPKAAPRKPATSISTRQAAAPQPRPNAPVLSPTPFRSGYRKSLLTSSCLEPARPQPRPDQDTPTTAKSRKAASTKIRPEPRPNKPTHHQPSKSPTSNPSKQDQFHTFALKSPLYATYPSSE